MTVFTLPNPRSLEKRIAKKLDANFVKNSEWRQFLNGEWYLRVLKAPTSALVIGRTDPPGDHLLQTLTLLDTLKRNGVKNITLLIPYFGYSRQDRVVRRGDHLPADLFLKLFKTCGAKRIITIDLHGPLTQEHSPLPLNVIDIAPLFAQTIKKTLPVHELFTVVSPDTGGRNRATHMRNLLRPSAPVCWLKKVRDPKTGHVHARELFGTKKGTTALIVDDILDTGSTIKECITLLKKHGFTTFYLAITHPIFSANATQTIRALHFKKILVSNTLPLSPYMKKQLLVTVIDVAPLVSKHMSAIFSPPVD